MRTKTAVQFRLIRVFARVGGAATYVSLRHRPRGVINPCSASSYGARRDQRSGHNDGGQQSWIAGRSSQMMSGKSDEGSTAEETLSRAGHPCGPEWRLNRHRVARVRPLLRAGRPDSYQTSAHRARPSSRPRSARLGNHARDATRPPGHPRTHPGMTETDITALLQSPAASG